MARGSQRGHQGIVAHAAAAEHAGGPGGDVRDFHVRAGVGTGAPAWPSAVGAATRWAVLPGKNWANVAALGALVSSETTTRSRAEVGKMIATGRTPSGENSLLWPVVNRFFKCRSTSLRLVTVYFSCSP